MRLSIAGYVLEAASASDLALAVVAVADEEAVCPPHLCLSLFEYVAQQGRPIPNLHTRIKLGLTHREQELVEQISLGLSNKEIAAKWNLAEQTVRNHVHRVLKKLGAPDRFTAADICQAEGFLVCMRHTSKFRVLSSGGVKTMAGIVLRMAATRK